MRKSIQNKGFTLLEILLVIGAIGILAAIVLVAINPNRQLEAARNAKRRSDINTITKAIQQYSIDNNGQYPAGIETGAKAICREGTPVGCIDLSILAPTYIASIPEPDSNYYYVRRSNNNIEVSHPRDNIWNIGGTPSLDLNFASNKSLIDSVSGKNLIDFTRNSTGTYVGEDGLIKTAGINEPRFDHDPTTGESLGLLAEEGRSNFALRSQEFNSSPNQAINASISSNVTVAPDGTLTADKLVEDNISSIYKRVQQGGFNVSGDYTVSFFVKEAGRYRGYIQLLNTTNASVSFNLQTGTASGVIPSRTKIEPYPNGWYRVSTSNTFNAGETPTVYIVMLDNTGNPTYVGDGSSGLYIWGLQVEQGSFPTSYIPTTTASVTRNTDLAIINGTNFSNWYNQSEGTIYCSSNNNPGITTSTSRFFYAFERSDGQSSDFIRQWIWNGSTGFLLNSVYTSNNGPIAAEFNNTLEINNKKTAIAYKQNDFNRSYNGSIPSTDNVGNIPFGIDQIRIGTNLSGHISKLIYYPRRLTNSQLQLLTQ